MSAPASPRSTTSYLGEEVVAPVDPAVLAAFHALAQRPAPVFGAVRKVLRDEQTAHEVTQDALLLAWRKLPTFRAERGASVSTWVCGIGRNLALNRGRRLGEALLDEPELLESSGPLQHADALRALSRAEREELVRGAIEEAGLDPADQEVVYLRYAEELSRDQVAELVGLADAEAVRVVLQRCSRSLRRAVERRLRELGHGLSFVRSSVPDDGA